MSDDIKYKKKELQKIIAGDNERELCFLMLYWVYEKDAYSNLVIKKADKIAAEAGRKIDFARAMLYGTLTYSFRRSFLKRKMYIPRQIQKKGRSKGSFLNISNLVCISLDGMQKRLNIVLTFAIKDVFVFPRLL